MLSSTCIDAAIAVGLLLESELELELELLLELLLVLREFSSSTRSANLTFLSVLAQNLVLQFSPQVVQFRQFGLAQFVLSA